MVMARLLRITLVLNFARVLYAQPTLGGDFLEKKPTEVVTKDLAPVVRLEPNIGTQTLIVQSSLESRPAQHPQATTPSSVAPTAVAVQSTPALPEKVVVAYLNFAQQSS